MKDSDWEILYELHRNPNMTKGYSKRQRRLSSSSLSCLGIMKFGKMQHFHYKLAYKLKYEFGSNCHIY